VDIGHLDAHVPIVLLPARLETRFATNPKSGSRELRVRLYPDLIATDTWEPLTPSEVAEGAQFWNAPDPLAAWQALLAKHTTPRAADIVTQTANKQKPPTQPSRWMRAARSSALPDRWIVRLYRSGAPYGAPLIGKPIPDPLPLALSPDPAAKRVPLADQTRIDKDLLWTVDFDTAVEQGMAVRVDIKDGATSFDRVLAIGVKGSLTAGDGATRLEKLLDGHHYTSGLAFVRQGSPTSATRDVRPAYPPTDANGQASFQIEVSGGLTKATAIAAPPTDGALVARALGISSTSFDRVEGADRGEQSAAGAMNRALWPATWGYFLTQLMAPVFSDGAVSAAREHFIRWVRGRGPLPALRVGSTPYGLLPVTSLARWQPGSVTLPAEKAPPVLIESQLAPALRTLLPLWAEQVANVARVTADPTADPDLQLVKILSQDASTQTVRARAMLGADFAVNLFGYLKLAAAPYLENQQRLAEAVLARIGHPEWDPRIVWALFADAAYLYGAPFVSADPLSEDPASSPAYVSWLASAKYGELDAETIPGGPPGTLLYQLLRQSALTEYTSATADLLVAKGVLTKDDLKEPELVGVVTGTPKPTVVELARKPPAGVSGAKTLGDQAVETPRGQQYRQALQGLLNLSTAELERLLTETLDTCSHRIDAWITSLAAMRLEAMRTLPTGATATGVYLGGFAWAENVGQEDAALVKQVALADGGMARVPPSSGGYVHAPSLAHATTAAVLRSAYLSHNPAGGTRYAIDLSSARVRAGLAVLDAVRAGQPLGAVLGYQLERALHEQALDGLIQPLRDLYPLVPPAGGGGTAAVGASEAVAPRNVVDGLAVRAAQASIPFGNGGLPASAPKGFVACLQRLDDAIDAVSDLLTAESVHQLVRGSTDGASASLDATAKGTRPPEPEVVRTPRSGLSLTHRAGIVLGGDPVASLTWAVVPPTPRAAAAPHLDAWVGSLLGDPSSVRCSVGWTDASGATVTQVVTLASLGLRPLDVLALAVAPRTAPADSELDRRVVDRALTQAGGVRPAAGLSIAYAPAAGRDPATHHTFPEMLELARSIGDLVGGARPLRAPDLLHRESGITVPAPSVLSEDATRVAGAVTALNAAQAALTAAGVPPPPAAPSASDPVAVLTACRGAAPFGVAGAFVPTGLDLAPLVGLAQRVASELDRRVAAVAVARAAGGAGTDAVATATSVVQAVFGRGFVFLPAFQPINASGTLDAAIAASAALVGDAMAPVRWFQQAARVRPGLARWRKVGLYAEALGGSVLGLDVAQLPYEAGDFWMALPFPVQPANGPKPRQPVSGRVSLALSRPSRPAASASWVGLLVDEWSETIPLPMENTGVALHYEAPRSQPAQAVLVAVPPTAAPGWDYETLVEIVGETLDLAKVRAVDPSLLGDLAQLLPAIYLPMNLGGEVVATNLAPYLGAEAAIDTSGG
jgi:hypothetical protein